MRTSSPPIDVTSEFPFLAGRERRAWRLHPRRAAADLPLVASRIGGPIPWPMDEPVPRCPDTGLLPVPVIQLRRDSGLPLVFPDGAELMQILWYPAEYADVLYLPRLLVRYRALADLAQHTLLEPSYPEDDLGFRVQPCSVTPEPVIEYPDLASLADDERAAISAWEESRGEPLYQYLLSTCPGTKVGGYPHHAGQPDVSPPAPREYVLTLSDTEWDGGSAPRWQPAGSAHAETAEVGTYLKSGINVFIDRTQTPWRFTGAR